MHATLSANLSEDRHQNALLHLVRVSPHFHTSVPVVPIFLTLPNFFAMSIRKHTYEEESESNGTTTARNVSIYVMAWSKDVVADGEDNSLEVFLYRTNIWLYSVILKLVPCIVLTVITGFLIRALYKASEAVGAPAQRRQQRGGGNGAPTQDQRSRGPPAAAGEPSTIDRLHVRHPLQEQQLLPRAGSVRQQPDKNGHPRPLPPPPTKATANATTRRKRNTDRTTRLLIAILVLFLLTEFPQVRIAYIGCAV